VRVRVCVCVCVSFTGDTIISTANEGSAAGRRRTAGIDGEEVKIAAASRRGMTVDACSMGHAPAPRLNVASS